MNGIKLELMVANRKDGEGHCYALTANVGYKHIVLTWKVQDIAEVMGISVRELYEKYEGDKHTLYYEV